MVLEMAKAHNTGILETFVLGESYIAAGLLTSMLKGQDRIGMVFECGGPIKGINVEVTASGNVRGFLKNNPIPLKKKQKDFDLNFLLGPGFLSIIKYPEGNGRPFKGQVMITYGDIAKDLAHYYTFSENLPTAFNLSVKFDLNGNLIGAGGVFIQKMPELTGADSVTTEADADAGRIEEALSKMPSLGLLLAEKKSLNDIIANNFKELFPSVIGSKSIQFRCSCNKDLFYRYLSGLPESDKEELYKNGPFPVVTCCHNCNTEYRFSKKDIKDLLSLK